jgi:hypothetical protein
MVPRAPKARVRSTGNRNEREAMKTPCFQGTASRRPSMEQFWSRRFLVSIWSSNGAVALASCSVFMDKIHALR